MRWLALILGCALLAGCGSEGDGSDGDQVGFCRQLDRLSQNDPFLALGDTATAAEVEQAFAALVTRSDELVTLAPPDVRGAAADFHESAAALDSLLEDSGYLPAGVDARAYRDQQLQYAEASRLLLRYLEAEC